MLVKGDKILLLRRFHTGWQDGNYSLPAGHIDGKETVFEAMRRETKEEININVKEIDMKVVHVMHRISNDREYFDIFLTVKKWRGKIKNNEPNKCDDLSWFTLSRLPKNLLAYVKIAISNYNRDIFFSEK